MPKPPFSDEVLDNIVWHALATSHSAFADAAADARRYQPSVSIFSAVDRFTRDAWAGLAALTGAGRHAVLFRDEIPDPPPGWAVAERGQGHQMILERPATGADLPGSRPLTDDDVPAMVDLVDLTKPGPFAPRTIELGGYIGVFDDDRLVAMAGRRFAVPGFVEISAVCTHPDARRRGLGGALTMAVAAGIAEEGNQPLLHVAASNESARRVYEALGFVTRRMVTYAAVRAPGGQPPGQ